MIGKGVHGEALQSEGNSHSTGPGALLVNPHFRYVVGCPDLVPGNRFTVGTTYYASFQEVMELHQRVEQQLPTWLQFTGIPAFSDAIELRFQPTAQDDLAFDEMRRREQSYWGSESADGWYSSRSRLSQEKLLVPPRDIPSLCSTQAMAPRENQWRTQETALNYCCPVCSSPFEDRAIMHFCRRCGAGTCPFCFARKQDGVKDICQHLVLDRNGMPEVKKSPFDSEGGLLKAFAMMCRVVEDDKARRLALGPVNRCIGACCGRNMFICSRIKSVDELALLESLTPFLSTLLIRMERQVSGTGRFLTRVFAADPDALQQEIECLLTGILDLIGGHYPLEG